MLGPVRSDTMIILQIGDSVRTQGRTVPVEGTSLESCNRDTQPGTTEGKDDDSLDGPSHFPIRGADL
jgi:hypothetical protein